MPRPTKPKQPSRSAPRAQDPVENGKPRTASRMPALYTHYHHLPSASIKPNEPSRVGQYRVHNWAEGHCHTSIPTPAEWYRVADPDVVRTIHQGGRTGGPHPTTRSFWAYGVYSHTKAILFGNKILRMAGIVQMLHRHKPPYDKYPYAHPERIRTVSKARNQRGLTAIA